MNTTSRQGFTLGEVVISIAVLATAILSVALVLPWGLKAQAQSRYQIYASTKVLDIVDAVVATPDGTFARRFDRFNPNDNNRPRGIGGRLRRLMIFNAPWQFDYEQRMLSRSGNHYALPVEIARRLDSPNDEIQDILDDGGYLFYTNTAAIREFNQDRGYTYQDQAKAARQDQNDLQTLVFAVKGSAQQNLLPVHPFIKWPYYELYPFPPQGRSNGTQILTYTNRYRMINDNDGDGLYDLELIAANEPSASGGSTGTRYQWRIWEWMATNDTTSSSRWAAGFDAFKSLVDDHWLRIVHQLGSGGSGWSIDEVPSPYTGIEVHDRDRKIRLIDNDDSDGTTPDVNTALRNDRGDWPQNAVGRPRGVPHPPNNNTDLHFIDDTIEKDQVMHGMPGYLRRLMYREAALDLLIAVSADAGDPLRGRNPLLEIIDPPSDWTEIHPTHIYALTYLAHASMLATGYRPPFQHDMNYYRNTSRSHNGAVVLQENANLLPFDRLSELTSGGAGINLSQGSTDAMNQLGGDGVDPAPLIDSGGDPILPNLIWRERMRVELYADAGDALYPNSPLPPPYSDYALGRDALFRIHLPGTLRTGDASYGDSNNWLRRLVKYSYSRLGNGGVDAGFLTTLAAEGWTVPTGTVLDGWDDLKMARNATETAARWARLYLAQNPYDTSLPRPINLMTIGDRPMYAFDLFDDSGNARRMNGNFASVMNTVNEPFYRVMAGRSDPLNIDNPGKWIPPFHLGRYADVNGDRTTTETPNGPDDQWRYWWDSYNEQLHSDVSSTAARTRLAQRWWPSQPFQPAARCRELIVWSVDWKAYEDAESAPSAPMDAHRYLYEYERNNPNRFRYTNPIGGNRHYDLTVYMMGNPESDFSWMNPRQTTVWGWQPEEYAGIGDRKGMGSYGGLGGRFSHNFENAGRHPWTYVGLFGADRNQNERVDRGNVPASQRMTAREVARFIIYDPISWQTLSQ